MPQTVTCSPAKYHQVFLGSNTPPLGCYRTVTDRSPNIIDRMSACTSITQNIFGKSQALIRPILRCERGQGNMFFFPAQLTTSRIGNLTRLTHTLVCDDHTYHVAVSQRTNRSPYTTEFCLFIGSYHPARHSGQPLDLARPLSHSVLLHPPKRQVSQTLTCPLVHILHTEFPTVKRNCPYFISLVCSRPHIISPTTDHRGLSRSDPARASSTRLS